MAGEKTFIAVQQLINHIREATDLDALQTTLSDILSRSKEVDEAPYTEHVFSYLLDLSHFSCGHERATELTIDDVRYIEEEREEGSNNFRGCGKLYVRKNPYRVDAFEEYLHPVAVFVGCENVGNQIRFYLWNKKIVMSTDQQTALKLGVEGYQLMKDYHYNIYNGGSDLITPFGILYGMAQDIDEVESIADTQWKIENILMSSFTQFGVKRADKHDEDAFETVSSEEVISGLYFASRDLEREVEFHKVKEDYRNRCCDGCYLSLYEPDGLMPWSKMGILKKEEGSHYFRVPLITTDNTAVPRNDDSYILDTTRTLCHSTSSAIVSGFVTQLPLLEKVGDNYAYGVSVGIAIALQSVKDDMSMIWTDSEEEYIAAPATTTYLAENEKCIFGELANLIRVLSCMNRSMFLPKNGYEVVEPCMTASDFVDTYGQASVVVSCKVSLSTMLEFMSLSKSALNQIPCRTVRKEVIEWACVKASQKERLRSMYREAKKTSRAEGRERAKARFEDKEVKAGIVNAAIGLPLRSKFAEGFGSKRENRTTNQRETSTLVKRPRYARNPRPTPQEVKLLMPKLRGSKLNFVSRYLTDDGAALFLSKSQRREYPNVPMLSHHLTKTTRVINDRLHMGWPHERSQSVNSYRCLNKMGDHCMIVVDDVNDRVDGAMILRKWIDRRCLTHRMSLRSRAQDVGLEIDGSRTDDENE